MALEPESVEAIRQLLCSRAAESRGCAVAQRMMMMWAGPFPGLLHFSPPHPHPRVIRAEILGNGVSSGYFSRWSA